MKYKFKHSVVGGTFDRMHKGHESLLTGSFSKSEKVTIGITSNEFASQRIKNNFEDYEVRLKQLEGFLKGNDFFNKAVIIKLEDIFGTTLSDDTIDSIIVTSETIEGANAINAERVKRGLRELRVEKLPLVLGQKRRVITSTNIRLGLTDRYGYDYFSNLGTNKYVLPDDLRPQISKPQGKIISENDLRQFNYAKYSKIILVGDIVTKTFIKHGINFDFAVVDLKSNRRRLFKTLDDLGVKNPSHLITVKNRRGTISKSMTKAVKDVMFKNLTGAVIKIIGEEDLAVIPAVILAPLGSVIFYGQRDQGIVCIEVGEKTKEKFLNIIELFEKV